MNKLSIKRGLKFYHTLVLHIPTVESYSIEKLSPIDLASGAAIEASNLTRI